MQFLKNLVAKLEQPSTHAGLAALFMVFGLGAKEAQLTGEIIQNSSLALSALFGLIAAFKDDKVVKDAKVEAANGSK